jgi:hypothetical protein
VEEWGFKKWVATALYTQPDEGGFKAWKTTPEDAPVDEGGFRAWKTTTKEDTEEDKWRFGRTSTGEKATETCAPQWSDEAEVVVPRMRTIYECGAGGLLDIASVEDSGALNLGASMRMRNEFGAGGLQNFTSGWTAVLRMSSRGILGKAKE